MAATDIYCERCGEKLNPKKAVLLDLNVYTHEYRAEPWPESESQGGFWFGSACAKRALKGDVKKGGR